MNRAPYHSDVSEQHVIGACSISPECVDAANLKPEHFFHMARRVLWATIIECRDRGILGDEAVLEATIRDQHPEQVVTEWIRCLGTFPVPEAVKHHAEIIREHALTRAVLSWTSTIQDRQVSGQMAGTALLSSAQSGLQRLAVATMGESRTMKAMLRERFDELDRAMAARLDGKAVITGIPTGIEELDQKLGGIHPGIVTMIIGRPAMGKTALVQSMIAAACEAKYGVHVFALEDRWQSFVDRAMARMAHVPIATIKQGRFQQGEFQRMTRAAHELAAWHTLRYESQAALTVAEIIARVRRERHNIDTKLVVLDYIQLVRWPRGARTPREAMDISAPLLMQSAKDDDIAYLVVSQMSRLAENRPDPRPKMSDARESGVLEQVCKAMLGMYRPHAYDESEPEDQCEILVLKNNDGPTGRITAKWDGPTTRVY